MGRVNKGWVCDCQPAWWGWTELKFGFPHLADDDDDGDARCVHDCPALCIIIIITAATSSGWHKQKNAQENKRHNRKIQSWRKKEGWKEVKSHSGKINLNQRVWFCQRQMRQMGLKLLDHIKNHFPFSVFYLKNVNNNKHHAILQFLDPNPRQYPPHRIVSLLQM